MSKTFPEILTAPNRVRAMRMEVGYTQEFLAKQVGISRGLLSAIETGKVDPSVTKAMSLAHALATTVEGLWFQPKEVEETKITAARMAFLESTIADQSREIDTLRKMLNQ